MAQATTIGNHTPSNENLSCGGEPPGEVHAPPFSGIRTRQRGGAGGDEFVFFSKLTLFVALEVSWVMVVVQ